VAEGVCADLSTEAGARRLLEGALAAYGRVDLLVNNAGASGPPLKKAWELEGDEWRAVLDLNLTGAFLCSKLFTAWMTEHGVAGRVINVSSGAAQNPIPGMIAYAVSKSALESLTRAFALDAGRGGVAFVALELGTLQTGLSRPYVSWEDFQLLPPPGVAVPLFLHAAIAPAEEINGRTLAAWRFARDPGAEGVLSGPLALLDRVSFSAPQRNGREVRRGDPSVTMLDRAENARGMPGRVKELLARVPATLDLSRYPDGECSELRAALSRRLGLAEACFTFGTGGSELVERTVRTFAGPGDEVLSNQPTWFMFPRFCAAHGVALRTVPVVRRERDGIYDHNLEGIARAVRPGTRMIYLVSPSNPLGNGIDCDDFLRFLERVPPHLPVIVDEAYREFSSRPETLSAHEVVMRTDRRVIGLRTFSKFYGLAGLRLGYAFAAPDTMRLFNRLENPFTIPDLSQAVAVAALEDEEHARRVREGFDRERRRIQERLAQRGLEFVPSETHFMLVEAPAEQEKIFAAFEKHDIFVPRGLVFDRYIFFPIAGPEQNDRNLDILCSLE